LSSTARDQRTPVWKTLRSDNLNSIWGAAIVRRMPLHKQQHIRRIHDNNKEASSSSSHATISEESSDASSNGGNVPKLSQSDGDDKTFPVGAVIKKVRFQSCSMASFLAWGELAFERNCSVNYERTSMGVISNLCLVSTFSSCLLTSSLLLHSLFCHHSLIELFEPCLFEMTRVYNNAIYLLPEFFSISMVTDGALG
jgi:hypothetical protein